MLLAWSQLFRSKDTFGNYLNHVRTACLLVKQPIEVNALLPCAASDPYCIAFQVFSNPALKKAKQSILSAGQFSKRERLFVQRQARYAQLPRAVTYFSLVLCRQQIESMLRWAETEEDITHSAMALLFLVTYVFLLRLPSEALPIEVGRVPGKQQQAVLEMDEGKLILTLMRRKNRPAGSKLERTCWCRESCRTCPVHVLGPAVRGIQPGTALFGGFTAAGANSALKDMLGKIGVPKAKEYRTHDIRRGHARDLQLSGDSAPVQ